MMGPNCGKKITNVVAVTRPRQRGMSKDRSVLTPHIVALLTKGVSVFLDFPANTKRQRAWFRQLIEMSGSDHELHFIVASDELCKRQLKQRSQELGLPPGAKWTTAADFDEITAYFDPPVLDEGFNVIRHERHA